MRKSDFTNKWIKQRTGALPSAWDDRNLLFSKMATLEAVEATPEEYKDLLEFAPFNFKRDQKNIGTCVGWNGNFNYEVQLTLLLAFLSDVEVHTLSTDDMSAGWLYQMSREYSVPPVPDHVEGSTNAGLCRALHRMGAVTEQSVPTDVAAPFDWITVTDELKAEASLYRVTSYHNVPSDPATIKATMYGLVHELPYSMPDGSHGKTPLIAAIPIHANFRESHGDGIVPMPEGPLLGGHSVMIIGWCIIDGVKYWIMFNSWGPDVGDNGIFYLPENYPFYANDWYMVSIVPVIEPPVLETLCIYPKKSFWASLLNATIAYGDAKFYNGVRVED